jgi:hypothetical protein
VDKVVQLPVMVVAVQAVLMAVAVLEALTVAVLDTAAAMEVKGLSELSGELVEPFQVLTQQMYNF